MSVKHAPNTSVWGEAWKPTMQLLLLFEAGGGACARTEAVSAEQAVKRAEVEEFVEADAALVPVSISPLMVEPVLLDPKEVAALLDNLVPMLEASANLAGIEGVEYESNSQADRRGRGDSKLPAFAWLFSDYAGTGRSARHQQGNYFRARRSFGKKARSTTQQAQGTLFGDRVG
jgi:hypothetical protein